MKRKREREHAKDAEKHSWRQFRKGQDLVHGDGLNAPRKSAKQRDMIERLTNTGEWKLRSELDSLPKSCEKLPYSTNNDVKARNPSM